MVKIDFPISAANWFLPRILILAAGLLSALLLPASTSTKEIPEIPGFHVATAQTGAWPDILRSFGLPEQAKDSARIIVLPENNGPMPEDLFARLRNGRILILEGDSAAARAMGIRPTSRRVHVRSIYDMHQPDLSIIWEEAIDVTVFEVPSQAKVLARDSFQQAPLMATLRFGQSGSVLWIAVPPGTQGYERFPFLLHTLSELGLRPLFESRRLWAFFDSGFQHARNLDKLAREWRQMGLASIHVGAWYYFEPHTGEDARLHKLIEACHREGILVYAWLELPHVSEEFWNQHPEWREQTALLNDARVDWRLLMNLVNSDCRRSVIKGIRNMLERFDWDGVNLAELYFDGTAGINKPNGFTPLNSDVRREVQRTYGFDPVELFAGQQPDAKKLRIFLDYRADLAARLQENWIDELEKIRAAKPHLDLVLTYVDDRFDTTMRDAIGADSARLLKVLEKHELTFIIEDPGTVWRLGPKRYAEIAARYRLLTPRQDRLGVDINIVKREQAHPTKQQTGVELAQLIHTAATSFPTVMYYYTGSITPLDAPLLPVASAVVTRCELSAGGLLIESPAGVGVRWSGPVTLDGQNWPVRDAERVWMPAGKHILRPATGVSPALVTDFTGNLENAAIKHDGLEIIYSSQSRAFARLNRKPVRLLVDGQEAKLEVSGKYVLRLPRGRHTALIKW
jgi:hypothetical protein